MKQFSQLTNKYGYTKIPNELVNDQLLSWKAKGLFCHMASKPDNWVFSVQRLAKSFKDGKASIFAALNELKARGWVTYLNNPKAIKQTLDKPKAEKPVMGIPTMGKSEAINKKDLNSNKDIYKGVIEKSAEIIYLPIGGDQLNPSTKYTEREILMMVQQGVIDVH